MVSATDCVRVLCKLFPLKPYAFVQCPLCRSQNEKAQQEQSGSQAEPPQPRRISILTISADKGGYTGSYERLSMIRHASLPTMLLLLYPPHPLNKFAEFCTITASVFPGALDRYRLRKGFVLLRSTLQLT